VIFSLAVIFLFVTSMVFTLLNQPVRTVVGSASVERNEAYWQNFNGNSSTPDSRYLINYIIKITSSSDKLTIIDKIKKNMTQIVIAPEYDNVQTSYDQLNGEIKVSLTKLGEGENYTIQVAFKVPPQTMFEGEAPATICTPIPDYGYSGRLEVNISPFKLKDADGLKDVGVYGWFTTLVTEKIIVSSSPIVDAQPPDYETVWFYASSAPEYGAHTATYNVTIKSDASAGDILLRTWIEADYEKDLIISSDPIFEGAEVSFRSLGSSQILQYEYVIGGN
jgi:hypothetical protein